MKKTLYILITLTFLAACATVAGTGRKQFITMSYEEEQALGLQSFNEVLSSSQVITGTAEANLVNKVGRDLATHAGVDYNWKFVLIKDNQINAFCLPGGKVAVYSGILPIAKDADGLAVVMGHEIAHALARHGAERMSQSSLLNMGGQILGATTTNANVLSAYGLASNLGVMLPYSRKHESEADYLGLMLMAKAGYDPRKAVDFWQRMSAAGSSGTPQFLSTHPSDAKRIADIQKHLSEAMQYYTLSKH
ncbi:Putative peptidase [Elusimicrobium minutum Pei191]|uniref:Putative peptidase n=1 Tax=Elusimicrobium minutum (strain Pei191) TaxID=445932 RepID=B2KBC8_ELUMP|nr:M48 family metallopeptidase [Elusimicrobium minutum]ACC97950.1 Putative peptidase [Elusimicrobium minutum Pei191]